MAKCLCGHEGEFDKFNVITQLWTERTRVEAADEEYGSRVTTEVVSDTGACSDELSVCPKCRLVYFFLK